MYFKKQICVLNNKYVLLDEMRSCIFAFQKTNLCFKTQICFVSVHKFVFHKHHTVTNFSGKYGSGKYPR